MKLLLSTFLVGLLTFSSICSAYVVTYYSSERYGHYRGYTVTGDYHRYYHRSRTYHCEWVAGYTRYGYWHPSRRICWRN